MLTGVPPTDLASRTPTPRRRIWPWAAGSILVTLAVIAATLIGHRLAARARLASEVAPAPALPPLAVQAVAHAPGQITHLTLDARTHTLVAQIAACLATPPSTPQAPQAAACDSASVTPVTGVAFFDSATGAQRSEYLAPTSAPAQALALADTTRGVTYVLNNGGVTTYANATGQQTNQYGSALAGAAQAAALDEQSGLIYTLDSKGNLSAFSAANGQTVASVALAPVSQLPPEAAPQLTVDGAAGRIYVFAGGHNQPGPLFAFSATTLTPLGWWRIPQGLQLGPLDPATHLLFLSGANQSVWQLDLATLPANGAGQTLSPGQTSILPGASRFSFDHATGAVVVENNTGIAAFASGATRPYASLPLVYPPSVFAADASPWLPPVDASAGLAYLPGDDNTILLVSLAQPTRVAAPTASAAVLIARAGMVTLLPDTNQNPPFVTAQTFPVAVGAVARQYFVHYADLGWKGPYAGTASVSAVNAGATPGDYTMTFTITWNQLFLRQHSWSVEVTPDGRTHLLAESGDAIP